MDGINLHLHVYCLFVCLLKDEAYGNSNSTDTSSVDTTGLKVGISFAVLAGGLLIAAVIAKLVNMCLYRRHSVSDSKSQISDTTRDLIQTRLALIRMKQRDIEKTRSSKGPDIRRIFTQWSKKVKNKIKLKEKEKVPKTAKLVVSVNHVKELSENKTNVNGITVSPRLSIFSGAQNGTSKSSKDISSKRNSAKNQTSSPTRSNSVVEKDRQLNSMPHGARKTSNGNIPNIRHSANANNLSLTRSNSVVENSSPIRSNPYIISSSPGDINVLSAGNKQTMEVMHIEVPDTEAHPPDISS